MRTSDLIEIQSHPLQVFASPETAARAQAMAARCIQAHRFLELALGLQVEARVLALAPQHWQAFTGSPMFGIPQTVDERTVVIAGEDAELWTMIAPPLQYLPPAMAEAMRQVYGGADGGVTVAPFMDLLSVHEIGHLFVDQAAGAFDFHRPRRWVVELFCNLCLHAYVVSKEPDGMAILTTFPQAVVALGHAHLSHRRLADFERLYGNMEPPNFAWYQCRLHVAAGQIYDAGGMASLSALFQTIIQAPEGLSDEELADRLHRAVHPVAAEVLTNW